LLRDFPYYVGLNENNRKEFLERLYYFAESKKFVPRQHLAITDEMRVLISACAIQLTFGLDNYYIDYFENVLVYPDIYQSPHSDYTHHGEVNLAGFICFSWKSLKKGIGKNDNFNVGLHEWSHALRFNGFRGNDGDTFFERYFLKWLSACNQLYNDIRTGRDKLFNKYGGSNIGEFFPVLMEHFFENPVVFKENYPLEYEYTCVLLNQDPLNQMNPAEGVRKRILSTYTFHGEAKPLLKSHGAKGSVVFQVVACVSFLLLLVSIFQSSLACMGFFFIFTFVPLVVFFVRRDKLIQLTTSGLIKSTRRMDPLARNTKKYPWQKIIRVEFVLNDSSELFLENYSSLHFTIYENGEFETLNLYTDINKAQAEVLEKFFYEHRVGVMRKKVKRI
jgi:MtfA peptidase